MKTMKLARITLSSNLLAATVAACFLAADVGRTQNDFLNPAIRIGAGDKITCQQCVETALVRNRDLQIERLNPVIARLTLSGSYGIYDPVFSINSHRDAVSDSGGFDPADLSKDAVYEAKSCSFESSLSGYLPSGLTYALGYEYANSYGTRNNMMFDSYNLYAGITISQPLLKNFWIDQTRMQIKINKKDLRISELGAVYLAMDVINQVQQAYYDFIEAWEYLQIQDRLLLVREQLHAGIQLHVRHGKMSPQEEQLALSQVARVKVERMGAQKELCLAESALRTLMGDPFTNAMTQSWMPAEKLLAVPHRIDINDCIQSGLAQRPDILQLKEDLAKAEIDIKYRRNQLFPSLDLVASYGRRGASTLQTFPGWGASPQASFTQAMRQINNGDNPNEMVGIVFSIPLTRKAERTRYHASKEIKEQALLRILQREEWVLRQIADAVQGVNSDWERIKAARQAIVAAEKAVQVEQIRLEGGKAPSI